MYEDRKPTTATDRASILADFRRRFADRLRGVGLDRIRVVIPGDEPGEYQVAPLIPTLFLYWHMGWG